MDDHTPTFPENITEYAPWVSEHGLRYPYGECQCGCGDKTNLAKHTDTRDGILSGQPTRYIRGHHGRVDTAGIMPPWVDRHGLLHPYGKCQCGCGGKTGVSGHRDDGVGNLRGCHVRFLPGHGNRTLTPIVPPNPAGLCMCGCGKITPLAKYNNRRDGTVKGEHTRYAYKHHSTPPPSNRFWRKVKKGHRDACWEWQGATCEDGYGKAYLNSKNTLAHRVSWGLTNGPIPNGLHVLHKCDNPPCCNPKHLFLGTQGDNIRDMFAKGRKDSRGSANSNAKLTETQVKEIRSSYALGESNTYELAQKYGVSQCAISCVIRRKTWAHIS